LTRVHALAGGRVPRVDPPTARRTCGAVHAAIVDGLVRACHDPSEGGLAVAIAEMAFAGGLGASIDLEHMPHSLDTSDTSEPLDAIRLFSESNTRFLCEVSPAAAADFEKRLATADIHFGRLGQVTSDKRLQITAGTKVLVSADINELKAAWQQTLDSG
jgi:phosphoribosylformylglycinamidine synthase